MSVSPLLQDLESALRCLPGVGSANSRSYGASFARERSDRGLNLAKTLHQALVEIEHCECCRMFD